MKIVVNIYGHAGTGIIGSKKLQERYAAETGKLLTKDTGCKTSSALVRLVEELGPEANGDGENLTVAKLPDNTTDVKFMDYRGQELILYVVNGKIQTTTADFL